MRLTDVKSEEGEENVIDPHLPLVNLQFFVVVRNLLSDPVLNGTIDHSACDGDVLYAHAHRLEDRDVATLSNILDDVWPCSPRWMLEVQ